VCCTSCNCGIECEGRPESESAQIRQGQTVSRKTGESRYASSRLAQLPSDSISYPSSSILFSTRPAFPSHRRRRRRASQSTFPLPAQRHAYMATPSSSATSPSPPVVYLPHTALLTPHINASALPDSHERDQRKKAVQKFLARAEVSMVCSHLYFDASLRTAL
jgi:hypothetical protein